jgi:hypothetical protein
MSIDQLLPLCKEQEKLAQLEVYQRYYLIAGKYSLKVKPGK